MSQEHDAIVSKTGGGLVMIGCDYGAEESVAIVMERRTDGSFIVHDMVKGKGLNEVLGGTSAARESDDRPTPSPTVADRHLA